MEIDGIISYARNLKAIARRYESLQKQTMPIDVQRIIMLCDCLGELSGAVKNEFGAQHELATKAPMTATEKAVYEYLLRVGGRIKLSDIASQLGVNNTVASLYVRHLVEKQDNVKTEGKGANKVVYVAA